MESSEHHRPWKDPQDWKDRDTFGLNTQAWIEDGVIHHAGGNVRTVAEGGYKEYTDALKADKEATGNSGSGLAGAVRFTLNGEINYISGGHGWWNNSDEAIAYIEEAYDLPCWGALKRRDELEGEN